MTVILRNTVVVNGPVLRKLKHSRSIAKRKRQKKNKKNTDLFMFDCCYERLNLCVLAGVRFGWGELPSVGDHTRCNCKEAPKFQSN